MFMPDVKPDLIEILEHKANLQHRLLYYIKSSIELNISPLPIMESYNATNIKSQTLKNQNCYFTTSFSFSNEL